MYIRAQLSVTREHSGTPKIDYDTMNTIILLESNFLIPAKCRHHSITQHRWTTPHLAFRKCLSGYKSRGYLSRHVSLESFEPHFDLITC
jgi:hypothetical protein